MDNKITDKGIIKALEELIRVSKEITKCKIVTIEEALDLINRQKAEIERLSDRNHKCVYLSDDETTQYCVDAICPQYKTEEQIKSEAITAFAEEVERRCIKSGIYPVIIKNNLHNVKNEMLGETNERT